MVEYEPGLVEEAVLVAPRGQPEERAFRRERDLLYEIRDAEARETAFRKFHVAWFQRLDLGRPVGQALGEQPAIAAGTKRCRIAPARSRQEEGAELFVRAVAAGRSGPSCRWVVIRLRPQALSAPDALLQFLRHELFHIADMLDSRFGYEPHLPPSPAGPAHERLLQDRYRVLWDTVIDGRLARLGWAPAAVRAERLRDFLRAFPMLGPRTEEAFARFFDGATCAHADLVAFAARSDSLGEESPQPRPPSPKPRPGERCPLCRFPTHAFEADPLGLSAEVIGNILADFPAWEPAHGLCRQCADLYRARCLHGPLDSAAAAA